jgi:nitroreductase/dihydropteridine reductase
MTILDALDWRYAVKKFSNEKIASSELTYLLNAARLTASSYGFQPL